MKQLEGDFRDLGSFLCLFAQLLGDKQDFSAMMYYCMTQH